MIKYIFFKRNGQRAGEGGFGYLSDWLWWAGFLSMALGEKTVTTLGLWAALSNPIYKLT